jgi:hypothetical protein
MTTPIANVTHAPAGLGCDTASVVTDEIARALVAQGYRVCARYLHRSKQVDHTPNGSALSVAELQTLLGAGLGVVPVQFGSSSLVPSSSQGQSAGEAAAFNADGLGFPAGVTVWCDIEWRGGAGPLKVAGRCGRPRTRPGRRSAAPARPSCRARSGARAPR